MVLPPGKVATGDRINTDTVAFRLIIPSDIWIIKALLGMLIDYASPSAWDSTYTEVTPRQAADVFNAIWESATVRSDIGNIILFAGPTLQPDLLPCDGAAYYNAAYPALVAAIGYVWGGDGATYFNVPDLRGCTVVNAGVSAGGFSPRTLGQVGGEETHILQPGEVPTHAHDYITAVGAIVNGGLEAPAAAAIPGPSLTGYQGGGAAHNNMPPFGVVTYAIIAR